MLTASFLSVQAKAKPLPYVSYQTNFANTKQTKPQTSGNALCDIRAKTKSQFFRKGLRQDCLPALAFCNPFQSL